MDREPGCCSTMMQYSLQNCLPLSPRSLAPLEKWSVPLQSYNCMAMPHGEEQMPLPLQIAATATLVMSEFKVADQVTDNANSGWKLIGRVYSQSFLEATARMRSWEYPVKEMWDWNVVQQERETAALRDTGTCTASETLASLQSPTAVVTGLTFQHGARIVGADRAMQETNVYPRARFWKSHLCPGCLRGRRERCQKRRFQCLTGSLPYGGNLSPTRKDRKQSARYRNSSPHHASAIMVASLPGRRILAVPSVSRISPSGTSPLVA